MVQPLTHREIRCLLPRRPQDGHKGTFGHLVVAAGSQGFAGAVKLACQGAYRSGVGLVTACVPSSLLSCLAASLTETMLLGLSETSEGCPGREAASEVLAFSQDKSAILLGPGLSRHPETVHCVWSLCRESNQPLIVDADGLNALSENREEMETLFQYRESHQGCADIFTPHPGEMSRLCGLPVAHIQKNRVSTALEYARQWHVILVLKGKETLVAAPDGRIISCPLGNEGLATGGSGDVLAGIMGALVAQDIKSFDAAAIAVYVHGLAGDLAAREKGIRAMIASDIIEFLPAAWKSVEGDGL
ncbi:MAG: NAD(P)H-hydrate dehydratase [Candidatus Hydrogenedens sp.]|nr:NAD(P)H-hydrate dehydratase [Candidatus Hydrogenedens sp.]